MQLRPFEDDHGWEPENHFLRGLTWGVLLAFAVSFWVAFVALLTFWLTA